MFQNICIEQTARQPARMTHEQTNRRTDGQRTDGQAGMWAGGQAGKRGQADRQTNWFILHTGKNNKLI